MSDYNNDDNDNENDNKLKISIALFPDVIKSASQKSHIKFKYNIEWRKSKKKIKILSDSLKRKVLIHFLKLFKEATFLTPAGSLFQSAGVGAAAAAKERAPSVGSIFFIRGTGVVAEH